MAECGNGLENRSFWRNGLFYLFGQEPLVEKFAEVDQAVERADWLGGGSKLNWVRSQKWGELLHGPLCLEVEVGVGIVTLANTASRAYRGRTLAVSRFSYRVPLVMKERGQKSQ